MQSRVWEAIRTKMGEWRLICDREILIQQHRINSALLAFQKFLQSAKLKAQEPLEIQARLRKLKAELREAEAELVTTLTVLDCDPPLHQTIEILEELN